MLLLLQQDATHSQFLRRVYQVWIQSFPSRLVTMPRLKGPVYPTILPMVGFILFPIVLRLCEMQTASKISTRLDDNHYTTVAILAKEAVYYMWWWGQFVLYLSQRYYTESERNSAKSHSRVSQSSMLATTQRGFPSPKKYSVCKISPEKKKHSSETSLVDLTTHIWWRTANDKTSCNLQCFWLRCGTMPYQWVTLWESNSLEKVY